MNKQEALDLLKAAPQDENTQSRVNLSLSQATAVKLVRDGIETFPDEANLSRLFEKRVWQVVKNQIRPKF